MGHPRMVYDGHTGPPLQRVCADIEVVRDRGGRSERRPYVSCPRDIYAADLLTSCPSRWGW